jgi:galactose mutarotase-like enzyme
MSEDSSWLALSSGALTAMIDPLGAQLSVLRDGSGRELLWNGDPAFWTGRAPLLFPIVGALANGVYRLGGSAYALPRHGFARGKRFEVLSNSPTTAELALRADEQTLAVYPFYFRLQIRFEIARTTLTLTTSVKNDGDAPMPASFGYHPAFRWPLPFGAARSLHEIEFERDEPDPVRRLDSSGQVTPVRYPTPIRARRLLLDDELFKEDAMILDAVRSRSVTYGAAAVPRLTVQFPDTPYLGLWSKPGAPFVCIEPWYGMADPVGFSGEFTEKPGVFVVPPGTLRQLRMQVTLS